MNKIEIRNRIFISSALMLIIVLVYLWHKDIYLFFDFPALAFIISFSFLLLFFQTSQKRIYQAFTGARYIWQDKTPKTENYFKKLLIWSKHSRLHGVVSLENFLEGESNVFARQGLELLVNANFSDQVENILFLELEKKYKRDLDISEVFRRLSLYFPLVGAWAAIINLINLPDNAMSIGFTSALVSALQPVFYGIFLGTVVFYSIYEMIRTQCYHQYRFRRMVTEGLVAIGQGTNPLVLEKKLLVYLSE